MLRVPSSDVNHFMHRQPTEKAGVAMNPGRIGDKTAKNHQGWCWLQVIVNDIDTLGADAPGQDHALLLWNSDSATRYGLTLRCSAAALDFLKAAKGACYEVFSPRTEA
jgi:hypothetical protein